MHEERNCVRYLCQLLILLAVSGCTVAGTGTRTVIKARSDVATTLQFFPHFVTNRRSPDGDRVAVFRSNVEPVQSFVPSKQFRYADFVDYLRLKYGTATPASAAMSLGIRDLGKVPTLSATLQALTAAEVVKIMTDSTLTTEQKVERKELLLAQLLNAPQAFEVRTRNRTEDGCELFYYYPHVELEYSATVLSPSHVDRFSELIFLVRLSDADTARDIRFVNFEPKATDVVEFTRGILKDQTQTYLKGTYGVARASSSNTIGRTFNAAGGATEENSEGTTLSPSLGGEVGFTHTEAFERDLRDAIDRKTHALVESGRTFVVDLRALRHVRIGGSYAFDVMLEVPATSVRTGTQCVSVPDLEASTIHADIILLGVVRHVADPGYTGVFRRVLEPENDDVYEQVVLRELPQQPLWHFDGEPATRPDVQVSADAVSIEVFSNIDDARYVVTTPEGAVLGEGAGRRSKVELSDGTHRTLSIRFLAVPRMSSEGKITVLSAGPPRTIRLASGVKKASVVGEYQIR